jgi:hypothetical protein
MPRIASPRPINAAPPCYRLQFAFPYDILSADRNPAGACVWDYRVSIPPGKLNRKKF